MNKNRKGIAKSKAKKKKEAAVTVRSHGYQV